MGVRHSRLFGSLEENEASDNDSDIDEADDRDLVEVDTELSKNEFHKLFNRRLGLNMRRESVNKILWV